MQIDHLDYHLDITRFIFMYMSLLGAWVSFGVFGGIRNTFEKEEAWLKF